MFISFFAPPMRELAYLDPGSGSLIIQLLIAGLVGAGFIIKTYWKKITRFFRRSPAENSEQKAVNFTAEMDSAADDDDHPQS